jgi:RNA polymerase sigma-70 factor, ECF subfamily
VAAGTSATVTVEGFSKEKIGADADIQWNEPGHDARIALPVARALLQRQRGRVRNIASEISVRSLETNTELVTGSGNLASRELVREPSSVRPDTQAAVPSMAPVGQMVTPPSPRRNSEALVACAPILTRYIRRRVRSDEEAADLFQEVSLLVLRTMRSPDDDSCFVAWCKGLARNTLAHHYRGKLRRAILLERAEPEAAAFLGSLPGDPEHEALTRQRLERLFAEVDHSAARLMLERYLLGKSAEEIARRLAQSPASIRMRLMRLRTALLRGDTSTTAGRRKSVSPELSASQV